MSFTREVKFSPAWDRRDEGQGVHSAEIHFILKGPFAYIQLSLYTNWLLPEVRKELDENPSGLPPFFTRPFAADYVFHCRFPQFIGDTPSNRDCSFLDGKPCYTSNSAIEADKAFDLLIRNGDGALWEYLEKRYHSLETPNTLGVLL